MKPPYTDMNPNALVPMIEDGRPAPDESSAILKYLADKIGSPAYPKDLESARQGQRDDGLDQHQFLSRLGVQPYLSADLSQRGNTVAMKRKPPPSNAGSKTPKSGLKVLNDHWIGPKEPNTSAATRLPSPTIFGAAW